MTVSFQACKTWKLRTLGVLFSLTPNRLAFRDLLRILFDWANTAQNTSLLHHRGIPNRPSQHWFTCKRTAETAASCLCFVFSFLSSLPVLRLLLLDLSNNDPQILASVTHQKVLGTCTISLPASHWGKRLWKKAIPDGFGNQNFRVKTFSVNGSQPSVPRLPDGRSQLTTASRTVGSRAKTSVAVASGTCSLCRKQIASVALQLHFPKANAKTPCLLNLGLGCHYFSG